MIDLNTLIIVMVAGFSFSLMPGPSMMYILSHSIKYKFKGGLCSSLGLATGGAIHALLAALGISALMQETPDFLFYLKIVGALYLLHLAFDIFFEKNIKKGDLKQIEIKNKSYSKIFFQSILVEFLNPHTILFFLAFIPQFTPAADVSNPTLYIFILALLIPLTAIPTDLFVVFTGSYLLKKIENNNKCQYVIKFIASSILLYLSINLLFSNFT